MPTIHGVVYTIQYGKLIDGFLEGGADSKSAVMAISDAVGIDEVSAAMNEALRNLGVPEAGPASAPADIEIPEPEPEPEPKKPAAKK
jgi:hypothetical protein